LRIVGWSSSLRISRRERRAKNHAALSLRAIRP